MDLQRRKAELETELAKGESLLRHHTAKLDEVRKTMMHVEGALALLNELLTEQPAPQTVQPEEEAS